MADYTLSAGGSLKFKGEIKDNCNNTSYKGTWDISGDTSYFTKSDNSSDNTTTITTNGDLYGCDYNTKNITLTWTSSENSNCSAEISIERKIDDYKYKIEIQNETYYTEVGHSFTLQVKLKDIESNTYLSCVSTLLNNIDYYIYVIKDGTMIKSDGKLGHAKLECNDDTLNIIFENTPEVLSNVQILLKWSGCAQEVWSKYINVTPPGGWAGTDNSVFENANGHTVCQPILVKWDSNGSIDSMLCTGIYSSNGLVTSEGWKHEFTDDDGNVWCTIKYLASVGTNAGLCGQGWIDIVTTENTTDKIRKTSVTLYKPTNQDYLDACAGDEKDGAPIVSSWSFEVWQAPKDKIWQKYDDPATCPTVIDA